MSEQEDVRKQQHDAQQAQLVHQQIQSVVRKFKITSNQLYGINLTSFLNNKITSADAHELKKVIAMLEQNVLNIKKQITKIKVD